MNCKFCDKEINQAGSLAAHEKCCKQNPERIPLIRSPNAGLRKGNIPWNTGLKIGRPEYLKEKYSDDKIFIENSTYARHALKKQIRERKLIEYHCAICGIDAMWQGKEMPLILDHINGINNDNRLENLRFVCSNCDTQLPTYKSKNRKTNQ